MEVMSFRKKNGGLYEIELNTGEKYKIYDDVILKYELLINRKIDKKMLEQVLSENGQLEAYYKALKYIVVKMRTEKEIERYLLRSEYQSKDIEYAVKRLRDEGALDNKRYVKAYINDSLLLTLDGPKKIRVNLGKLGIGDYLIDPELDDVTDREWKDRIGKFIDKRAKTNKDSALMFKNKTTSALIGLGYPIEFIKEVLDPYEIDTGNAFLKSAEKVYSSLERKYSDKELELRFRSKMFSKGYDSAKISEFLDSKK